MLIPTKTCRNFALSGLDADFGRVKDFFVDDRSWAVRYLVADTVGWMRGRRVLISPHALRAVQVDEHVIPVELTRQQVEASPEVSSDEPVSRHFEAQYHRHFGWPAYWSGAPTWIGGSPWLGVVPPLTDLRPEAHDVEEAAEADPHLRSTADIIGYHIAAIDGEIGHVADVIINDDTWGVAYVLVDTGTWWPGRKMLIPRDYLESVSWGGSLIQVHLSREVIRLAPEMPADGVITAEYEVALHMYYQLLPH